MRARSRATISKSVLHGEADTLTGGTGADQAFGEAGADLMVWNPGEGSDRNEGGAGNDTVLVIGGNASENFTVAANGNRVRFDRVDPAPFFIDIGTSENLVVNANGGDDRFAAGLGLAPLIKITVDGGDGDDVLIGGGGNDFIDGNRGNDVAYLGDGDDVFQWDPGDGSDVVEGQGGHDTMLFNGAAAGEAIDISANAARVRFFRDLGNITMDLDDVEQIDFNALGGADSITVRDLTGTDVSQINLNLDSGGGGDGQADQVIVEGTDGDDTVIAAGDAAGVAVIGLAAHVNITGAEAATDRLIINGRAGDDAVDASGLADDAIRLTVNGGDGADILIGGAGDDVLNGDADDDVLLGGLGEDLLDGGLGDNIVIQ